MHFFPNVVDAFRRIIIFFATYFFFLPLSVSCLFLSVSLVCNNANRIISRNCARCDGGGGRGHLSASRYNLSFLLIYWLYPARCVKSFIGIGNSCWPPNKRLKINASIKIRGCICADGSMSAVIEAYHDHEMAFISEKTRKCFQPRLKLYRGPTFNLLLTRRRSLFELLFRAQISF